MNRSYKTVKSILLYVITLSLFYTLFNQLTIATLHPYSLGDLLGLSNFGWQHLLVFQPFTSLFIIPSNEGLSFSFILNLFFNGYLIWTIGNQLCTIVKEKAFLKYLIILSTLSGAINYLFLFMFNSPTILLSITPLIGALMLTWIAFFPQLELYLFFTFKLKAKWCAVGLIGISLLSLLSEGKWIESLSSLTTLGIAYFYNSLSFGKTSSFLQIEKLDLFFVKLGKSIKKKLKKREDLVIKGKIIDIRSLDK